MHTFRVYKHNSPIVSYIKLEEGNINIETGIRMHFSFLDKNKNLIEKHLFCITGDEFISLGKMTEDIRIAIIEKILEYTGSVLIKD